VTSTALDNGLDVVLDVDHRVPVVSMVLRYEVGERDELPGQRGAATLAARMMQSGTVHVPKGEYARAIEHAGGTTRWGTGYDATTFEATVPASAVPLVLWLWSDQMGFFAPRADAAMLEDARALRRAERRRSFEDASFGRVRTALSMALYPPGHPYRATPPGEGDEPTLDQVKAFFDSSFAPNRAALVLTGDFDPAATMALVRKYFGPIPRATAARRAPAPLPDSGDVRIEMAANVRAPAVVAWWPSPPDFAPGDGELDLAAELLAGRGSSYLYWRLGDDRKVVTDVSARQRSHELGSEFEIWASVAPGRSAAEVLDGIDSVIANLRVGGIPPYMFPPAAREFLNARLFQLEDTAFRAEKYAAYSLEMGDANGLARDVERYRAASADAVRAEVRKTLVPSRRVVALVTPDPAAPREGVVRAVRRVGEGAQ
jgi:predicted Zn-dependent peptidase